MKIFTQTKTLKAALKKYPWACKVIKVDGGYMCFEFLTDYLTWQNQK